MLLFWKEKERSWQLCHHPAALLLTLNEGEKGWWLSCLGKRERVQGSTLEERKRFCENWLANYLQWLGKFLKSGIANTEGKHDNS